MRMRHTIRTMLGAALVTLTLALAACGSSALGSGGGSTPGAHLSCTDSTSVGQVDVIHVTVNCSVAGASANETSFRLRYTVSNADGQQRSFDQTCEGTLHNGAGNCTTTYALIAPFEVSSSSVEGVLLPSNDHLGPVAPKDVTPPVTPNTGGPLGAATPTPHIDQPPG